MVTKAIIFDFWGTLVENGIYPSPSKQAKYILRVRKPFNEFIIEFEKAFMSQKFENLSEAFDKVIKDFGLNPPPFVRDKLVGMWNKNTILAKPYPETTEVLKELRNQGFFLALAANCEQFSVDQVLDKYQMRELFDVIALSYEEGVLKSQGKLFTKALDKLGVEKEECLVVGDSVESDIEGARHIGIPSVLIDRKNNRDYPDKITSLKELLQR